LGWRCDDDDDTPGSDHVTNSIEQSTSRSGTMERKIGHMEEKDVSITASSLNQEKLQNQDGKDDINPSISDGENNKNLDENVHLNQNTMSLQDTTKTMEQQSSQRPNHQKDTLISSNSTIFVPTSQNDGKNVMEQYYSCYYCSDYKTDSQDYYERHVIKQHGLGHPCFPSKVDIERLGLKPQGKDWEI